MGINALLEKQNCHKTFPVLAETIISWKICVQYAYPVISSWTVFLSILNHQTAIHHFLQKNPPSFVYTQEIRKHWVYLWGNWACINIFHMSLIWNFREMFCVTLFLRLPHTLGCAVRRCSLSSVFFINLKKEEMAAHLQTVRRTVWWLEEKRKETGKTKQNKTNNKKKKTLLISAKSVSFTVR